ncbi:PHP domain-containing protein [Clostridium sp. SM-530-WT-3G]|uniref:PHP domain-containing protein n=1 Tax=Clostridium sp. SM-530-WT-3G TaxID=2725303 RepID=UPI00145E3BAC|nr:PHP domain-containing protein [Clostridium sp. SM-530-WT-3G]NME83950.1 PHP domain-containing protein [Clostridium sp. SM-530-WT-3G]
MLNKGDFHIHSTASDGNCTPSEIITLAKKQHIDIISITDHNTTAGIDEAISYGKKTGVKVIPGVELSTKYNNTRVHILGYFKDDSYKNELLQKILKNVKSHKISEIKKLLHGYLNCYYRRKALCIENGIEILRFFGATVVLAHPVLLPRKDFNEIIKLDFDGIEAKYSSNTNADTEYFINIAKSHGLFYTAGSDFHKLKEMYRIHGLIGNVFLNESEILDFLSKGSLTQWAK